MLAVQPGAGRSAFAASVEEAAHERAADAHRRAKTGGEFIVHAAQRR